MATPLWKDSSKGDDETKEQGSDGFNDGRPAFQRRNFKYNPHVLCQICKDIVSGSDILADIDSCYETGNLPHIDSLEEASSVDSCEDSDVALTRAYENVKFNDRGSKQHSKLQLTGIAMASLKLPVDIGCMFPDDNRPTSRDSTTAMETIVNYIHLDQLSSSAETGCHFCSLIHYAVTHPDRYHNYYYHGGYLELLAKYIPKGSRGAPFYHKAGHVYCNADARGFISITISEPGRQQNRVRDSDIKPVGDLAQLSGSTCSDAHFDLARSWLRTCEEHESHAKCQDATLGYKALPSRLLDLTSVWDKEKKIRLCKSGDIETRPRYATLSHCWGSAQPLLLTSTTEPALFQGISCSELPATFKDAVLVCHQLGLKFLWIDSLCIKQDSAEDWLHESSIMGDIYRGGTLNISTLWAKDCHDGCFAVRNPLINRACSVSGNDETGLFVAAPDSKLAQPPVEGVLSTRGWVFQERLLSPRTLHFKSESISWECRSGDADEERQWGVAPDLRLKQNLTWLEHPEKWYWSVTGDPKFNKDLGAAWHVHKAWTSFVNYYTNCKLTYPDDILVGIHGVTSLLAERTGLQNVAGLWTACIALELMWFPTETINDTGVPFPYASLESKTYQAPSWSWASLGRQVQFALCKDPRQIPRCAFNWRPSSIPKINLQVNLKEAVADAKASGQLTSAYLVLEGLVRRLKIDDFKNSEVNVTSHEAIVGIVDDDYSSIEGPPTRWLWDYTSRRPPSGNVWAILLARCKGFTSHFGDFDTHQAEYSDIGLVLEAVKDKDFDMTFRRVGIFEQFYFPGADSRIFADCKATTRAAVKLV